MHEHPIRDRRITVIRNRDVRGRRGDHFASHVRGDAHRIDEKHVVDIRSIDERTRDARRKSKHGDCDHRPIDADRRRCDADKKHGFGAVKPAKLLPNRNGRRCKQGHEEGQPHDRPAHRRTRARADCRGEKRAKDDERGNSHESPHDIPRQPQRLDVLGCQIIRSDVEAEDVFQSVDEKCEDRRFRGHFLTGRPHQDRHVKDEDLESDIEHEHAERSGREGERPAPVRAGLRMKRDARYDE